MQVCILSTARDALKVSYMVPLQACAHGHVKCAETLLDAGALISAHKTNGFTPLHYAAAGPHLSIVRLLISRFTGLFSLWTLLLHFELPTFGSGQV